MILDHVIKVNGGGLQNASATVSVFPTGIDTYYEPFVGDGAILIEVLSQNRAKHHVVSDPCKTLLSFWQMLQREPTFLSSYYRHRWQEMQTCGRDVYRIIKDAFATMKYPEQMFFMSHTRYGKGRLSQEMDTIINKWSSLIQNVEFRDMDYVEIQGGQNDFVYLNLPISDLGHAKISAWLRTVSCPVTIREPMTKKNKIETTVEIKSNNNNKIPKALKCVCLVCNKQLDAIEGITSHNAEIIPNISGGVVFRSRGQFGSTILDCGVGIPHPWGTEIQIIVCDECLIEKCKIINTTKNKRGVIERRSHGDFAADWSDYSTFAKMLKDQKKYEGERYQLFEKMMKNHENRKISKEKKAKRK